MSEFFLSNNIVSQAEGVVEKLNLVALLDGLCNFVRASGLQSDANSLFELVLVIAVLEHSIDDGFHSGVDGQLIIGRILFLEVVLAQLSVLVD